MTYAKLVNGEIQFAPNPIHVGGNLIGNPTADLMLSLGWKPVVFSDPPESDYLTEPEWLEKEHEIVQTWTISESESVNRERV